MPKYLKLIISLLSDFNAVCLLFLHVAKSEYAPVYRDNNFKMAKRNIPNYSTSIAKKVNVIRFLGLIR